MDNMENQIGASLGNPEMMEKIRTIAGSLSGDGAKASPDQPTGDVDLSMIQKLSGLAGQNQIDKNQRALLGALRPYLSQQRLQKLERAMKAAKMAAMAGVFPGKFSPGR